MRHQAVHVTHFYRVMSQDLQTPLHYAARNGHIAMVEFLCNCGADIEALAKVRTSLMTSHSYNPRTAVRYPIVFRRGQRKIRRRHVLMREGCKHDWG